MDKRFHVSQVDPAHLGLMVPLFGDWLQRLATPWLKSERINIIPNKPMANMLAYKKLQQKDKNKIKSLPWAWTAPDELNPQLIPS